MTTTFLAILLAATVAPAAQPRAVPVEGEPFAAALTAIDARGQLHFQAGGKERLLPLTDLVIWGQCAEAIRGPIIVLADGGLLAADVLGADKETLSADSDPLGTLKLPLETLSGVIFRWPGDRLQRDLLLGRVARAGGQTDRLVLDNGDELPGLVEAIHDDKVQLKAQGGPLEIETRRVVAIVFNPALKQKPVSSGVRTWVGLGDGSRLLATRLLSSPLPSPLAGEGSGVRGSNLLPSPATGEGAGVKGSSPLPSPLVGEGSGVRGATLELTAAGQAWKTEQKAVVFLQPLGGRADYLSDRKPTEYRHVPFLDLAWPYAADRCVTGGLLRSGGALCLKGLGVHSAARLSYTLERPYRRFAADIGIDDSTDGRGSVVFRVLVDGVVKYASGPISGGDAPQSVSIDLTGAKRLDLVVDFGPRGDELDRADWLGARLVR
ncbi:MAG: NPCBM/NEW2 domain-containing protein [Thermoguttaceae bacterium]|jgi:hypothetical protein